MNFILPLAAYLTVLLLKPDSLLLHVVDAHTLPPIELS